MSRPNLTSRISSRLNSRLNRPMPSRAPFEESTNEGNMNYNYRPFSSADSKPQNRNSAPRGRRIPAIQAHFVAATGEFVGTFMFLYLSYMGHMMLRSQAGEVSILNGQNSSQMIVFAALIYGLSLLVNVWAFFRISGGLFNPAVTLGMMISDQLPWIRGLCLIPAQLVAGIAAAALVSVMIPGDITNTSTTLASGTSIAQGLFIEMFITAELVFVVLMLAGEKNKSTFLAPIGIGLALFVAMISGGFYTGASLNPARSLGPAVAGSSFPGYHWIYWVGPLLGGLLASGYFRFVKFFHYEQANPGQDSTGCDVPPQEMRRMAEHELWPRQNNMA